MANAIKYMYRNRGHDLVAYLDDFGSAAPQELAEQAYLCLGELLNDCSLE